MASKPAATKPGLHRTTVEIELDAYETARDALGTRGYKDTVNAALGAVAGDLSLVDYVERSPSGLRPQLRLRRTILDIDLDAYGSARAALGTRGYKDTVNRALGVIARRKALKEGAERIRQGRYSAPTPEELRELRKPRTFF